MKKICTVIVFLCLLSSSAFATPNQSFMRDLTIETMLVYAKELYQRKDFVEARNVMARIKQLNANYLTAPKQSKKIAPVDASCCMTGALPKAKNMEAIVVAVDPNDDLIQAIANEDKILTTLNREVEALRLQIQATHHE